jgi:hypothetical protein
MAVCNVWTLEPKLIDYFLACWAACCSFFSSRLSLITLAFTIGLTIFQNTSSQRVVNLVGQYKNQIFKVVNTDMCEHNVPADLNALQQKKVA